MEATIELPVTGAQLVFLLGLGLMAMILLVRSRRYFRQVSRRESPRSTFNVPKTASALTPPADYERWEVAMHDLARDLTAQLDSKIRVLELLIRQADEAAERLERAASSEPNAATTPTRRQPVQSQPPHIQPREPQPPRDDKPIVPRPKLPRTKQPVAVAGNPRFERVYALADAGMSATTIANQIGSQVGEVELILSLRGTQASRD